MFQGGKKPLRLHWTKPSDRQAIAKPGQIGKGDENRRRARASNFGASGSCLGVGGRSDALCNAPFWNQSTHLQATAPVTAIPHWEPKPPKPSHLNPFFDGLTPLSPSPAACRDHQCYQ